MEEYEELDFYATNRVSERIADWLGEEGNRSGKLLITHHPLC